MYSGELTIGVAANTDLVSLCRTWNFTTDAIVSLTYMQLLDSVAVGAREDCFACWYIESDKRGWSTWFENSIWEMVPKSPWLYSRDEALLPHPNFQCSASSWSWLAIGPSWCSSHTRKILRARGWSPKDMSPSCILFRRSLRAPSAPPPSMA